MEFPTIEYRLVPKVKDIHLKPGEVRKAVTGDYRLRCHACGTNNTHIPGQTMACNGCEGRFEVKILP